MESYLCKCTNCENILYDENPQTDAKLIDTNTIDKEIFLMELLNDEGDSYFGCPFCQTDGYLQDFSFDLFQYQNKLPDEVQTIIGKFEKSENSYDDCQDLVRALNGVGYTCDYDLEGVPFGLRKLTISELEKITAAECKKLTQADRNKIANEALNGDEDKTQHERIRKFCTEYRDKNEYNPQFLDEYNAKFNAEFKQFLESGNFSQKIIELYTN